MTADISLESVDLGREGDFTLGPLKVRPAAREVEHAGQSEMLEPRVMQALVSLARRQGEVVSREVLIETCWEGRIVGDDAINRVTAKIRRLGMETGAFALETIPRVGYRLSLVASDDRAPPAPRPQRRPRRAMLIAVAAVLLLAAAGAAAYRASAPPLTAQTPVAVMPFAPAPNDEIAARFVQGADSEVGSLLTDNGVNVAEPSRRGRKLVVEGDAHSQAGRFVTRVRLRDPRSRTVLWSREFSAPVGEEARLKQEIGWRLTFVLQMAGDALSYDRSKIDAEALGLFLRGADEVVQGSWNMIEPAEALARRLPNHPMVHVNRATSLIARAAYVSEAEAPALRREAQAEIDLARKLDPGAPWQMPQALLTEGRQWAERERLIEEGGRWFNGQPNTNLANFQINVGRVRDGALIWTSVHRSRRAAPGAGSSIVNAMYLNGSTTEALARVAEYRAMRPSDMPLRQTELFLALTEGDFATARAMLSDPQRKPSQVSSEGAQALEAYMKAKETSAAADRDAAIAALVAASGPGLRRIITVPLVMRLGALDQAMTLSNSIADDPRVMKQSMFMDLGFLYGPDTRALREDPRFVEVADRLGLLKYWRSTGKWPDFCETEPKSVCARMKAGA